MPIQRPDQTRRPEEADSANAFVQLTSTTANRRGDAFFFMHALPPTPAFPKLRPSPGRDEATVDVDGVVTFACSADTHF